MLTFFSLPFAFSTSIKSRICNNDSISRYNLTREDRFHVNMLCLHKSKVRKGFGASWWWFAGCQRTKSAIITILVSWTWWSPAHLRAGLCCPLAAALRSVDAPRGLLLLKHLAVVSTKGCLKWWMMVWGFVYLSGCQIYLQTAMPCGDKMLFFFPLRFIHE